MAASRQINAEISAKVAAVHVEYNRFQAGGYEYNAANPELWVDLATYQRNNVSDETFVETVRQGFIRADNHSPVVNAPASTIQRNFDIAAEQTGANDAERFAVTVDDPIVTVEPDGARTELSRGEAGEITEMIDAVGSVIRFRYDQLQNLVSVAGPAWRNASPPRPTHQSSCSINAAWTLSSYVSAV